MWRFRQDPKQALQIPVQFRPDNIAHESYACFYDSTTTSVAPVDLIKNCGRTNR
jgi:hypothetical protein